MIDGNGKSPLASYLGWEWEGKLVLAIWESNVTPTGWDGTSVSYRGEPRCGKHWRNVGKTMGAYRAIMGTQRQIILGNMWV